MCFPVDCLHHGSAPRVLVREIRNQRGYGCLCREEIVVFWSNGFISRHQMRFRMRGHDYIRSLLMKKIMVFRRDAVRVDFELLKELERVIWLRFVLMTCHILKAHSWYRPKCRLNVYPYVPLWEKCVQHYSMIIQAHGSAVILFCAISPIQHTLTIGCEDALPWFVHLSEVTNPHKEAKARENATRFCPIRVNSSPLRWPMSSFTCSPLRLLNIHPKEAFPVGSTEPSLTALKPRCVSRQIENGSTSSVRWKRRSISHASDVSTYSSNVAVCDSEVVELLTIENIGVEILHSPLWGHFQTMLLHWNSSSERHCQLYMTSAVVLLWMLSHHQKRFAVPFPFLACSNN